MQITNLRQGEYVLAKHFTLDHVARDLDEGLEILGEGHNVVKVHLTGEAYDELLDDAKYYRDMAGMGEPEMTSLGKSAERVIRALRKQGRP